VSASRRELSAQERLDWLQLIRTDTIGPIGFFRLIERFGSAAAALDALPRLARTAGRAQPLKLADRALIRAELDSTERFGARLIADCEPSYPQGLLSLPDRPPIITVKGRLDLFERRAVAIIGARNASAIGRKLARIFAEGLGKAGFAAVSGLARGIDGAAHDAAMATGTIAVVAGGVDVVYPPEHGDLMRRIAEEGVILSERPFGHQPIARDFPRRNRLISGLSEGVVVVEAAAKSGTLLTARFAADQGREVFAAPGSPLDPRCEGSNRLIRDGAILVERAQDVIDALARPRLRTAPPPTDPGLFEDDSEHASLRAEVLEALTHAPIHRDDLLRELGASPGRLADALLDLILSGQAEEHPGGRFALPAAERD
jgi:DNA processing protein